MSINRRFTTFAAVFAFAAALGGSAVLVPPAFAQDAGAQRVSELSAGQIVQRLEADGYTAISKFERKRDYVEVKAIDAQGRRVELKLDPVDGRVIESETRADARSRDDAQPMPRR